METAEKSAADAPLEILFVDDEVNVLRSLNRLFMDENDYKVMIANSAEDALDIIKTNPNISLIISDQRMPGLTGVDFLEKAKEMAPDALRILLTGYADIQAVADAINRGGAYRYITKPWKDDELIQIIGDAAQHYSLKRENKRLNLIVKKQNQELKTWNTQLESRVEEQTVEIQKKNEDLKKINSRLKSNFTSTILSFSSLIELRDKKTANHSKNVADIAVKIARDMNLSDAEIESITAASLLHDIGKIGTPDSILSKDAGEMAAEELKEYMRHPVRGQASIDSVEDLRDAGVLIRHHHERFNGRGFPDKLSGQDIPLGSRIIAISDFIEKASRIVSGTDASKRMLAAVKAELGKRFDPDIYPYIENTVRDIMSQKLQKGNYVEKELNIHDIKEGMILSRDVQSGTGLILLTKGLKLTQYSVKALKRYYRLDPSKTGVFVLAQKE